MSDTYKVFFAVTVVLACFALLAYIFQLIYVKRFAQRKKDAAAEDLNAVMNGGILHSGRSYAVRGNCIRLLDEFILLLQNMDPGETEKKNVVAFLRDRKLDKFFIKQTHSPNSYRRGRAAHYLGYIGGDGAVEALKKQLENEKKENLKLYQIYALCLLGDTESIPTVIAAIYGTSNLFIRRTAGILSAFPSFLITLFYKMSDKKNPEFIRLMTEIARIVPFRIFPQFLAEVFMNPAYPEDVRKTAFECLMESYPEFLDPAGFIDYENSEFERIAINALGKKPEKRNADILLKKAEDSSNAEYIFSALASMIRLSDTLFFYIIDLFNKETNAKKQHFLARVLSVRFEYFLPGLSESDHKNDLIIEELIESGKTSDLIFFMNENSDAGIENRLVSIIHNELLSGNESVHEEFQINLKETVLQKLGLEPLPQPGNDGTGRKEKIRRLPLSVLLAGIIIVPVLFFISIYNSLPSVSVENVSAVYINKFLLGFGYYALVLDVFYFILAFLSFTGSIKERNVFSLKTESFLFLPHIMPSVSILTPAFCEQETIIESVESLLNIKYPDSEIIVINDGSTDKTLDVLISHFDLKKTDVVYRQTLQTKKIRGIYKNKFIPELTVIDKVNGGKADSLNAGVNFASKEYVLGTDSDCILERDSLLKLTAPFIDEPNIVIASGGAIVPANGCAVENGAITECHIPGGSIPKLQTLEYFRAFMTGRLGWSKLKTLMIISGAFGLFRKEQVSEVRGYLTSEEKYAKDTVGEDMEILIRLVRNSKERRIPYSILYSSQAVCWTEIPDSLKILKRQRDRWQRGLIDILLFHHRMFFNPKYGSHGVFGFPYYLIVEIIGPWFQLFSMILFAAGIVTRIISTDIFLFILASDFIVGFALTVLSLLTGNAGRHIFSVREQIELILYSFLEAVGFRFIISFFRITGYISALRNVSGWNKFGRKGFSRRRVRE